MNLGCANLFSFFEMTEKNIQLALLRFFSSHKYVFTNTFYFANESDFLSFLQSGYCYECEVKISRSDFKADFKKEKHNVHVGNENSSKYFLRKNGIETINRPTWDFCREFPGLVQSREYEDYETRIDYRSDLAATEWDRQMRVEFHAIVSSRIEFVEVKNTQLPNKFFYAVPTGLIRKEEVPEYAGLLYIDENLNVTKVKDGKFIHKDVLKPERLFNKTYYSYLAELHRKLKESISNF